MKNRQKIIISYLLISLFLVGCNNFLDIKPVGKVIPSTYQDFRELLNYAYTQVPYDRSLSALRGDELQLVKDRWGGYKSYQSIWLWQDKNLPLSQTQFPWQAYYKTILNANQVIENASKITAKNTDEKQINQLNGEAHLLRAYMHFNLVNLFSDVYKPENKDKKAIPLATKIDIWQNYERRSLAEVYAQIAADLKKGIALIQLENQPKGKNYRFAKVSAYGFAARFYLYMGDFSEAKTYAEKAYALNHKLTDLNSKEAKLPVHFASEENVLAMEQTFYSGLKNRFNISEKLLSAFDRENDLRFVRYFAPNGKNYRCALGQKLENKVSMRTAEFYLILAEAEAQLGNLNKAKEYIKSLIIKRLKPDYYTQKVAQIQAMDKAEMLSEIAQARFRELACQGFRWYDLRRYGKPTLTKTFDGKTYTLEKNDKRYTLPFPQEAVKANPNLTKE